MRLGRFLMKDNAQRWMGCHHPPWTARELAKKLGYDASFVCQVFGGQKQPSWTFLKKLAELTGLHDGGELVRYEPNGAERRQRPRRKNRKEAKAR